MDRFDDSIRALFRRFQAIHRTPNLRELAAWGRSLYAEGLAAGRAEAVDVVDRYWKFDDNQQPMASWHEKNACLDELRGAALSLPEKPAPDDGGRKMRKALGRILEEHGHTCKEVNGPCINCIAEAALDGGAGEGE